MVSVYNKAITEISNIGTSAKKITSEGLDNIFAELFSTVDMSSIESPSEDHTIITNKPIIQIEGNSSGKRYGTHKKQILELLTSWGMTRIEKKWPDQVWTFK